MKRARCGLALCLVLFACSESEKGAQGESAKVAALKAAKTDGKTYLDVHFVLGSSAEELIERFGEPVQYRPQQGDQPFGFVRWNDVQNVKVLAVIIDGACAYVNYDFHEMDPEMDPFDETAAFKIVGIERPKEDPTVSVPKTGVDKWYPFEQYDRLTVNRELKRVGVRAYPFEMIPGL